MRLTFDRALFGQVPSGATVRKLVVLRNISDCACDFAWDTAHPLWGTILSIYPSHGTLQVGQHLCCKLSLIGVGPPEELRTSLACALLPHVDPNAMTSSEAALAAAEKNAGGLGLLPASHPLAAGTALREALRAAHAGGGLRKVEVLNLCGNQMGDGAAAALAALLEEGAMPNLKSLYLGGNQIAEAGVAALASALRGGALPACTDIELDDNPGSDDTGRGDDSKVKEALASPERAAALARRQAE